MNESCLNHYTAGKNCRPCDWLRFLLGSCIHDPPFAKTRLTAQTLRSVAEISTNLPTKASLLSQSLQCSVCPVRPYPLQSAISISASMAVR